MYESVYTVLGVIVGFILHWLYAVWSRRDIISWAINFWVKAVEDGKVTVDEVVGFIEGLIEKLGLKDRVVVQKREESQ